MKYDPVILGEKMRQFREIRGFKQYEVARRLGISASLYSQIEKGKKNVSLPQLMEFAEMHNLPVSVVLGEPLEYDEKTQELDQTDLEILGMLREMDDKSKKQLLTLNERLSKQ